MCAGGKHRAERIDCQEMIPASRPPARRHASDSPIPANSDCTNNKLPPRDNNCGAIRTVHPQPSGRRRRHSTPTQSNVGRICSPCVSGPIGTQGGLQTAKSYGPHANACVSEPSRTSTSTPAACGGDLLFFLKWAAALGVDRRKPSNVGVVARPPAAST